MQIKKIENKINLDENVIAENEFKCNHDCVEYYYSGSTAKDGCSQKYKVTAKTVTVW
ncbi:hypothetical protein C8E03_102154 [Lachnotalea glycerini]|uniref:Uncharacterized protein n=1 Tax=Lachnotalea glycerini TaxID=1763509 RepID=A0A318ER01_9FIRM|nr:hypothetical protein [Lachnotalea glycerini]PXV93386.1 hypothetical protein C8E03_102154 [Lachnotalea glycerini]